MPHSAESILIIEYLREYEFIFETALAHESSSPGVLIDEKIRGSKISRDCPFKRVIASKCTYTPSLYSQQASECSCR
jgi:hypothetical protein